MMAETLPTEAPYTLQDILELLEYRANYAAFEQRRQQNTKSVYTDQPGNSASTQHYNNIMWSTINCPQPGRLSEQHAATIPLYRRLLKTARLDYESDLNPAILPVILCDAVAGTSKTLSEVWEMPAEEFERFLTVKKKPLPRVPDLFNKVEDLDLLRTEVAALHVPGTSRKENGETVSMIIANPDLLKRIARHGKKTDRKSLADFLQSCLQPKINPSDDII